MAAYGALSAVRLHDQVRCRACPRWIDTIPCPNCECSYYCSKECRVLDLRVHGTLCKSFAHFKNRPGPNVRRAIYFPVDRPHPEFVWLEMDKRYAYNQPDLTAMRERFLGGSRKDYRWPAEIDEDIVLMTEIYPQIIVACRPEPPAPLNKSLCTLAGGCPRPLRGPFIAYGQTRQEDAEGEDHPVVTDLDTTHLTPLLNDFLSSHLDETETITAVQIYSNGQQSKLGRRSSSTEFPSSYPFVNDEMGVMSQISIFYGMPLMVVFPQLFGGKFSEVHGLQEHLDSIRRFQLPDSGNRLAALLMMEIGTSMDSPAQDFGTIPETYRSKHLGTAIVIRKDMKPLTTEYLDNFCAWIDEDLFPMFTDLNGQIKDALATELDDEDPKAWQRGADLMELRLKMLNRCTRKRFYDWLRNAKGLSLGVLGKHL
ncbi:hypothetical protein E4T49_01662 [Aureobasidium sp. EXF-10728]|nr:hypothetical protein E4T49_01662 [Aureobasidium sp. EXF-10728]